MSHLNAIPVDMCGLWSGENRLIDLAFLFVHGNLGESSIAKAVCDIQNILATMYQTNASVYRLDSTLMRSNVIFQSFVGGGFCVGAIGFGFAFGVSAIGFGFGFGVGAAHSSAVPATLTLTGFAAHPSTAFLSAARVSGLNAGRVRRGRTEFETGMKRWRREG